MSRALGLGVAVSWTLFVACAGRDHPEVSAELAGEIRTAYDDYVAPGVAGGGGSGGGLGGGGGSGGAPAASSTGGSGGSAMAGQAGSAGSAGVSTGTAGTGGSGGVVGMCDGFAIIAANCGTSGCHGDGSNLEAFAASEAAARAFIGQPGTLACTGQGDVIDTDDPAESLMVRKLSEEPPCGQRMPVSGSPLSQTEVECIETWIGSL